MNPFPTVNDSKNDTLKGALDAFARERQRDIADWNSLPNTYIKGRKVSKIPANSSDITNPTSYPGDFNVTPSFVYFCINNAGTIQWVRAAMGTF